VRAHVARRMAELDFIQVRDEVEDTETAATFWATSDWKTCRELVLFVPDVASVDADVEGVGLWSQNLAVEHGLSVGSMLPYFVRARKAGMGIVCTTPNAKAVTTLDEHFEAHQVPIKGSATPEAHVLSCWDTVISHADSARVFVVANGYGALIIQHLMEMRPTALERLIGVSFLSSAHKLKESTSPEVRTHFRRHVVCYSLSDEPAGTHLTTESERQGCLVLSVGNGKDGRSSDRRHARAADTDYPALAALPALDLVFGFFTNPALPAEALVRTRSGEPAPSSPPGRWVGE
jgi:hypothetical protein